MMKLAILMLLLLSLMILIHSNNPMKASFSILMGTSMIFLLLKMSTGMTWMPMIFFILFTGGILMVFMILASILPNEKVNKIKMPKSLLVTTIFIYIMNQYKNLQTTQLAPQMKSFMTSGLTLSFMICLILIYFFSAVNLNTASDTSMRSLMC